MVNVWIHVPWKILAETMHFAEFQNIVQFACVQMATVVNQHKDALDQSVALIVIVKLINDVKLVHV